MFSLTRKYIERVLYLCKYFFKKKSKLLTTSFIFRLFLIIHEGQHAQITIKIIYKQNLNK